MFAAYAGNYQLAMGALTGAGMFVGELLEVDGLTFVPDKHTQGRNY
jgi:hypothetical protein